MNEIRCVIAFDFGLKRIGIAAGDTLTRTAGPRAALLVGAHGPDWSAIAREVQALQPHLLIVGAPYNVDDSPGALAPAASAFAAWRPSPGPTPDTTHTFPDNDPDRPAAASSLFATVIGEA